MHRMLNYGFTSPSSCREIDGPYSPEGQGEDVADQESGVCSDHASFKDISFPSYHYFQNNVTNKSRIPTVQLRYCFQGREVCFTALLIKTTIQLIISSQATQHGFSDSSTSSSCGSYTGQYFSFWRISMMSYSLQRLCQLPAKLSRKNCSFVAFTGPLSDREQETSFYKSFTFTNINPIAYN